MGIIKIINSKIIVQLMYILKVMIPAIISIISVLKVNNITYERNLHDPLGITQPLTNYRMSYQYSTTNINYTKTTLSHKEIISRGSIKSIQNREENDNQKNLQQKTKTNTNLQQTDKFAENLQQKEKSTQSVHTLGDRIPETKKKEVLYKNYKSWKRIAKNKKSKKTYKTNKTKNKIIYNHPQV